MESLPTTARRSLAGPCALALLLILSVTPAVAQQAPDEESVSLVYGIALGRSSGLYSDLFDPPPRASRTLVQLGLAPGGEMLLDVRTRLAAPGARLGGTARFRYSGLDQTRYYGAGNLTASERPAEYYRVEQSRYQVSTAGFVRFGAATLSLGPTFEVATTDADPDDGLRHVIGDPLPLNFSQQDVELDEVGLMELTRPYGSGRFAMTGVRAELEAPVRESVAGLNLSLEMEGSFHPSVFDVKEPFGRASVTLKSRTALPLPGNPMLAWRGGLDRVFGTAPFFEQAYLGGRSSIRGFHKHRFAGDLAFHSQMEVRLPLGKVDITRRLDYGILALFDAGRVYVNGESPGGWHTSRGAGFWVKPVGSGPALSFAVARSSEGSRFYVSLGQLR